MENSRNLENGFIVDPTKSNTNLTKIPAVNLNKAVSKLNIVYNSEIIAINLRFAKNNSNFSIDDAIEITDEDLVKKLRKIKDCVSDDINSEEGNKFNNNNKTFLYLLVIITFFLVFIIALKFLLKEEAEPLTNLFTNYTKEEQLPQKLTPAIVPLDPFKLNLTNENLNVELYFKLVLELADGHDIETLYASVPYIRMEVLSFLLECDIGTLKDETLRVLISKKLKDNINSLFNEEKVAAVYLFELEITEMEH